MYISPFTILVSDKVDFRVNKITRDRERYNIMINMSTHQEDIQF